MARLRHLSRRWTSPLVAAAILCGLASPAHALQRLHQDVFELPPGQELESELWLTAGTASFDGTARDDIYVYAQGADLAGDFHGDVWVVGTTSLVFRGTAENQVRLAGRQVRVDGELRKSLIAIGESVTLTATSKLDRAAVLVGDTVTVAGEQRGDVWIYANTATVQGTIAGALNVTAGDIVISPGTVIRGDLVYASSRELIPGSKVTVGGEIRRQELRTIGFTYSGYLLLQAILFLSTLIVAIPYLRWFPATAAMSAVTLRTAPLRCLVTGLILVWILPVIGIACLLVPWLLPVGVVLLALLVVTLFLSQAAVAIVVGSLLIRRTGRVRFGSAVTALGIGLLALYILTSMPIFNVATWLLVITLGSGALLWGCIATQQPMVPSTEAGGPPSVTTALVQTDHHQERE
jgi:hypothetical protein